MKKDNIEEPSTARKMCNHVVSSITFGEILWGHFDSHNGYSQYYKGELKNGVPHGWGGVYEVNMMGGRDDLLYQGRWVDGVYMDRKDSNGGMTEEELDEWWHENS